MPLNDNLKKGNPKPDAAIARWAGVLLVIVAAVVAYALFKAFGS